MTRVLSRFLAGALLFVAGTAFANPSPAPRLKKHDALVENAINRGLAWLAKHQRANGTFPGSYGETTAVSGLVGMAFLSKGYTPNEQRYGPVINKCIDYVLAHQRANGSIDGGRQGGGMYSHSISTLFLTQVSGMVDPERQKRIDAALSKAIKLLLEAQAVPKSAEFKGGWRYSPTSKDSDLSVSGWALMALRAARLNGAPVPKQAIDDAVAFVLRCHRGRGSFSYQPVRSTRDYGNPGLTGLALHTLHVAGRHDHPVIRESGDFLLAHLAQHKRIHDHHPYYAMYHCAQGMFQLGGKYWETFAEIVYADMLKQQHSDGYWQQVWGRGWSRFAYPTAMSILTLTASYEQLPAYQR